MSFRKKITMGTKEWTDKNVNYIIGCSHNYNTKYLFDISKNKIKKCNYCLYVFYLEENVRIFFFPNK